MNTKQIISGFLLAAALADAQTVIPGPIVNLPSNAPIVLTATATNDLPSLLQRGMFEEEGNRDYHTAIASYQSLIAQFDQNRQLAATAVFRLGECYRKLGQTNEAVAQYERIAREFSDQQTLATLSRQNIAGLGSVAQTRTAELTETSAITDDEEKAIRRIQTMIQDSPDLINSSAGGASSANGGTPLFEAASAGWFRVVTFLLDHGANINLKSNGQTPLHGATGTGNKAMVELLLDRGADVNARDGTGGTALHLAAEKGFRSVAEVLLAHHADINARNAEMNNTRTPLHRAAALGNVEMLKLLIAHGADVNARGKNGSTPLDSALGSPRQLESINALLAAKADPDIADEKGITPMSDAVSRGYLDVVKLLLDAKADPNGGTLNPPLLCAINQGNTNLVELLLRAGADPNRVAKIDPQLTGFGVTRFGGNQSYTNSPLGFACGKYQSAMVKLLLEFKANPNGKDGFGQPFIFSGLVNLDILKDLLEAGADPDSIQGNPNSAAWAGESPLMTAARTRFDRAPDGNSYSAANVGNLAAAKLLIAHGANVNARRPSDGATPLHLATKTDNRELVELLLASKADVNAPSNAGETPLDWAKAGMPPPPANAARLGIIELLRAHGAVDDLPDFKSIRVTRMGAGRPFVVFTRDSNLINRFTLLEVIRNFYRNSNDAREKPFPDFSKIIIHRPVPGKPEASKEITVNLMTVTNSFDCTKNMGLEFGDVVEIPEREHTLAEQPLGITEAQSKELSQCLEGKVTFVVRGEKTELRLDGSGYTCWLQMALGRVQNLLRSSSDLSHIKIKRTDPATKKTVEFIADSKAPQSDNLWLRNGDVIEVPDK